jgi:hypothetical protein
MCGLGNSRWTLWSSFPSCRLEKTGFHIIDDGEYGVLGRMDDIMVALAGTHASEALCLSKEAMLRDRDSNFATWVDVCGAGSRASSSSTPCWVSCSRATPCMLKWSVGILQLTPLHFPHTHHHQFHYHIPSTE